LLIVVLGEANSRKSSLLAAILEQKLGRVDAPSATARSHVFRYGPEEKSVESSTQLTERYLPLAFLHDFTVVDTPGTNVVLPEHQKIIETSLTAFCGAYRRASEPLLHQSKELRQIFARLASRLR
jgi:hypothetical protein